MIKKNTIRDKLTRVEVLMDTHGISLYKIIKSMGFDPTVVQTNWHQKVRGELPLSREEGVLLMATLETLTGRPINDKLFDIDKYRCV